MVNLVDRTMRSRRPSISLPRMRSDAPFQRRDAQAGAAQQAVLIE